MHCNSKTNDGQTSDFEHNLENILKAHRQHRLIHPCHERNKYSAILEWMSSSFSALADENAKDAKGEGKAKEEGKALLLCEPSLL